MDYLCDPNGFWTRYDVSIEVEQGGFVPPPPLPPPSHQSGSGGAGSGDRSKGKGKMIESGTNSTSVGSQPPAKLSNNGVPGAVRLSQCANLEMDILVLIVQGELSSSMEQP
jgi:hypothetical protein